MRITILADLPAIAQVTDEAVGRGGGHAATWLIQLAREFSQTPDLHVTWVTMDQDMTGRSEMHDYNQAFVRIPQGKRSIDILANHFFARRKLLLEVRQSRPDVMHVFGTEGSYASILGSVPCPTVLSMQGILTELRKREALPNSWRATLQSYYEPGWVNKATIVTCESQWAAEMVKRFSPGSDCRVVPYGVHPDFYQTKWSPDPESPAVLFCGHAYYGKGIDLLLAACELPPKPRWRCLVAGVGDYHSCREKYPRVTWLGNLTWPALRKAMQTAWVLAHPTRGDSNPNAVKEARVIGLPVVTSKHGGQAEYIRNGENGWIVDPLTPEGLRARLDLMCSNYELTRRMGACRLVEDRAAFRPERTTESFVSIYREIGKRRAEIGDGR